MLPANVSEIIYRVDEPFKGTSFSRFSDCDYYNHYYYTSYVQVSSSGVLCPHLRVALKSWYIWMCFSCAEAGEIIGECEAPRKWQVAQGYDLLPMWCSVTCTVIQEGSPHVTAEDEAVICYDYDPLPVWFPGWNYTINTGHDRICI